MRVLLVLSGGEFTVGELCQILGLPQSTLSRHLRTLVDGGWILARSEGTQRPYRFLSPPDDGQRALWRVVRGEYEDGAQAREDRERVLAVLAGRQDRSRDFFRTAGAHWDALRVELFGSRPAELGLPALLDPDWTVGDLGCGTGMLAAALAPWVRRVIAVDREPEMLEATRRRVTELASVEIRSGELEALPLADGELDAALCAFVLHLVARPVDVLLEALRALRPGGLLGIVDMREHTHLFPESMGHLWPGFSPALVEEWLEEAGFERVHVISLPADPAAKGPPLLVARGRRPLTPV